MKLKISLRAPEMKVKMEALGKEMLKHCKGLPLAIIALGGILATKRTINEWETVYKNTTSYLMSQSGMDRSCALTILRTWRSGRLGKELFLIFTTWKYGGVRS